MTARSPRERAAAKVIEVLDSPFLRALTEPARLEVLRVLLVHGPGDIAAIAGELPQDRSVVSRHLKVLEDAEIVRGRREGRHRVYAIDGVKLLGTLEKMLAEMRAIAPVCCPALDVAPPAPGKRG